MLMETVLAIFIHFETQFRINLVCNSVYLRSCIKIITILTIENYNIDIYASNKRKSREYIVFVLKVPLDEKAPFYFA